MIHRWRDTHLRWIEDTEQQVQMADFIPCVVFGKGAEFAMKVSEERFSDCGLRTYNFRKLHRWRWKENLHNECSCRRTLFCWWRERKVQKKQMWIQKGSLVFQMERSYRLSNTLEQSVRAHLYSTLSVCASCGAYFSERKTRKVKQMCISRKGYPFRQVCLSQEKTKGESKI